MKLISMNILKHIAILCLILFSPAVVHSDLLWSDDFESGIDTYLSIVDTDCSTHSNTRSHGGSYSMKSDRDASGCSIPQNLADITQDGNDMPPSGEVYISFWVYLETGDFDGKFSRIRNTSGDNDIQIEIWGSDAGVYNCVKTAFNIGVGCDGDATTCGSCNGDSVIEGQWNQLEFWVRAPSSLGVQDGAFAYWINRSADYPTSANATAFCNNIYLNGSATTCNADLQDFHLPSGYNSGSPVIYIDDLEVHDDLPEAAASPPSTTGNMTGASFGN